MNMLSDHLGKKQTVFPCFFFFVFFLAVTFCDEMALVRRAEDRNATAMRSSTPHSETLSLRQACA